ncbi:amidase [Poseidonocella sedimentorum]|uniref:Aspartyl-tRNA(Asn)/glutamyl-tRNA(Gln) amidotransferase subunit A n=1 Tax=Poseidonocella sedimentorum TaxID=871652 RepID=A0A1I6EB51_9RHOB|nr:amidase family protein [Poseidonocella sedimentorum]SFR14772.1 aspartyl-tRNA(Asn)/glutamyl-tRNA(Gln) amidotransferase subunit A [Poseidonocella sedimentorum]
MDGALTKSASALGREIGEGRIDPVALTEAYLAAIAAHPVAERIYARLTPERALSEARAARQRQREGARLGPLDGVPISWKDLFDSAGTATEGGSALLKGRVPETDAKVLAAASAMGLVCLGKTHMSELAFSGLGLNPVTATTPCINDPEAVSGGSSSGAAGSVAFGLAAAAIGSDTGGSVRIPAAWNDLVGLKTTSTRLSLDGAIPLAPRFDTVGPLCRSVEDAAQLLAALEGRAADDDAVPPLAGRRFAMLETVATDGLRETPARAYGDALARLSAAGALLEPLSFPPLHEAMSFSGILYGVEAYGHWKDRIEAEPDLMFPPIRERFRSGAEFLGADYIAAWVRLEEIRAQWAAATERFDAVLCPTNAIMPPKTERLLIDEDYYVTENLLTLRNTRIGNLLGLAVLTLPTATPSVGLSLMGRPFGEEAILSLGRAAEAALGADQA